MKINDVFKAILACAAFAAVVVPSEVLAEPTAYKKQQAAQKSQALLEKLRAIENKHGDEIKKITEGKISNQSLNQLGSLFKKIANEMYEAIAQSDAPEKVRDAALEYAQAISNFGITCNSVPYIPSDEGEAMVYGFFRGLAGDISGGTNEIAEFQRRYTEAFSEIERKGEKLKVIAIKYGVK